MDKLTVEQHLQVRYEVINDYPDSDFEVGKTIESDDPFWQQHFSQWPHLFKKLSWWQRREVDEMPEYLITIHKDKWVYRVHHHFVEAKNGLGFTTEDGRIKSYCNYLPATETEYLEYINKKQP